MKHKTFGAVLLVALLLAATLIGCGGRSEVRLGAAGEGGTYYAYSVAAADIIGKEAGIQFDIKKTAGSAANIRLLSEGYLDLAIAQSDVAADQVQIMTANV